MDSELLMKIIECLILVVAFVIATYLIPWLRSKVGTENLSLMVMWADVFVKAAEQMIIGAKKGKEKLGFVTDCLKKKSDELGLNLSEDDIRVLIEDAVNEMNKLKKEV